jgi:putative redox protein
MEKKESKLKYTGRYNFEADDSSGFKTKYSSKGIQDIDQTAHTPMDTLLQSVAACSGIDVASILEKKRKKIEDLEITITGERRDEHPKIFVNAHLHYILKSPDATEKDLHRSIELSQDKYCGASEMFKLAGAEVTWSAELIN